MRKFLESESEFKWPRHLGQCRGNYCDLRPDKGIPLKWIGKISDKGKASIDKYEAPGFDFREAFVVKTIRGTNSQKVRSMTANEVNNMQDLRHPHISALLGTFDYQERLSILIYPAACCDLHQYMKQLSKDLQNLGEQSHPSHALLQDVSPSSCTSTQDTATTDARHQHGLELMTYQQTSNGNHHDKPRAWPLSLSVEEKLELLRRYFVCLSQALSYLHESGVRHKDIKPKNILIDESGRVVLTDFGISRRFPKDKPHVTNNEWNFTRKYASPEMKDKRIPRDDPSDVFSLGCVFLEMATLLLGEDLAKLTEFYTSTVNVSATEEAYHCNLDKVYSWIDHLRESNGIKLVQDNWLPGTVHQVQNIVSSANDHMVAALVYLRRMLDEVPSNRPPSKTLWQHFQDISSEQCRDCDPRRPEDIWKPSIMQQKNAKTGLINRRSVQVEEDLDTEAGESFRHGEIDSSLLSAHRTLDRSDRRRTRGSSPSTSLRSSSRRDYPKEKPKSKSPIPGQSVKKPGSSGRSEKSTSPILHGLDISEKLTSGEEILNPSRIVSAKVVDDPALADRNRVLSNMEIAPPSLRLPSSSLRVAKDDSTLSPASNATTHSQAVQVPEKNQEKARYQEHMTTTTKEDVPTPQTAIVIYDVLQTIAYVSVFASLAGGFGSLPRSLSFLCHVKEFRSRIHFVSATENWSTGRDRRCTKTHC